MKSKIRSGSKMHRDKAGHESSGQAGGGEWQSQKDLAALIDNTADAIFKSRDGVIVWCNDRVQDVFGYSKEDLVGTDGSVLFPRVAEHSQHRDSTYRLAVETGYYRGRTEAIRKDGSPAHIEFSISRIPGKEPPEFVVVAGDITGRVLAEQALREANDELEQRVTERTMELERANDELRRSEERFRALIENSSEAITILDADGVLKYQSPSMARLMGREPDATLGRTSFDFVYPDDLPKVDEGLARLLRTPGSTVELDVRVLHADGSWRTLDIVASNLLHDPAVAGIVINQRDITERKRMETALRESEQSLRALIEYAPEAITAYDLEGTILDCNRKGEELLGYCREEMVGKNMFELGVIPEDYVPRANQALEKGDWDKSARPFEFELLRKDGSRITVEATTIAVKRGGKIQIICISRDVTERKQMEQQLQLAGRLAAVGELAAGVAHELNNPLTAVQGFAQYLAGRENVDEATRDDLETIYREAQRATRITGNLLSFARKHKPEKGFFSINDIVKHSLELHAYRMRVHDVEVVMDLAPDLPRTMVDYHQMQQVFVNMIANAEQAMDEKGGRGRLVVRTEQIAETIRVTFADNGPGMTGDVLKSVFDPFFTTKDVGRGTGLGLSICFGIVQEHGGRLYAESEPGRGATFVVELPVVAEAALSAGSGPTGTAQSAP